MHAKRFPAGHSGVLKGGRLSLRRYWNTLDHLVQVPPRYEEQVEQFRELFIDACRIRMRSDVPIGTALSGGIDSSAVASTMAHIARRAGGARVASDWQHAFVATFPGSPLDETGYARAVVDNAKTLAATLMEGGLDIVSGGTDTHLLLVDLRPKKLTGNVAEKALERAGLTCNKNGIPFDPEKPTVTSGVRLGSPAGTTRGFGQAEFRQIGEMIVEVLNGLAANGDNNAAVESSVRARVEDLCRRFPVYPEG